MSSITIYQSTTDLNDPELEQLISECQTIMTRGQNAVVDMCISMAEQQEHIKKTYKKKDRAAVQLMVINYVNVQATTYFKYARAGRHYIANPDSRHLSMDAILKKPKQLAAPAPKPPKVDKDQMIREHEQRIQDLERRVRELENEVDYRKEEVRDVRDWLDANTRAGSAGVYAKLGRTLH
jgi:hypothetical protein